MRKIQLAFVAAAFLIGSLSLVGQQTPEPPKPTPPSDVTITIVADGTSTSLELTPEAITIFNEFWHAQRLSGEFGERFIQMMKSTIQQLAMRPEFNPTAKAAEDKASADKAKAAADAAKPRDRTKEGKQ